jgi:hypothetical protein
MKFFSYEERNYKKDKNFILKHDCIKTSFFDKPSIFDFFNKKVIHFETKVSFQFLGRLNFSFDCFVMAMHFILH